MFGARLREQAVADAAVEVDGVAGREVGGVGFAADLPDLPACVPPAQALTALGGDDEGWQPIALDSEGALWSEAEAGS